MQKKLIKQRLIQSMKSGGTSDYIIKEKIIYHLKKFNTKNKSLLDYGAGKGELLSIINYIFNFKNLCGLDLYPKNKKIEKRIQWFKQDLNEKLLMKKQFDFIICSETIEHLENPRHTLRNIYQLMKKGSILILTMPNNSSIRSVLGLIFKGHFAMFLGKSYPAHITALVKIDLERICKEINFKKPNFYYTDDGRIPKLTRFKWQSLFKFLKGKYFSDNLIMIVKK